MNELLFISGKDAKVFTDNMNNIRPLPFKELQRIRSNYNLINSRRVEMDANNLVTIKPNAAKKRMTKEKYLEYSQVENKKLRIKSLAKILNQKYSFMITNDGGERP